MQPGGLYDTEFGSDFMMWALGQVYPEINERKDEEEYLKYVSPEHASATKRFRSADLASEEEAKNVILRAKETADLKKQAQQDSLDSMLDMPEQKLWDIRAQARAKGRGGSLRGGLVTDEDRQATREPTGGTFSQGELTPELAARNADTERWLGQQPERDLAYAMTPEMARRNPQAAASAAESLKGMRAQRTQDRQVDINEQSVANQEALINSLTGSGGKIPFETAMKLEVSGLPVPTFAIGMSKGAAMAKLGDIRQMTQKSINDAVLEGLPNSTVSYLEFVLSSIPDFEKMIDTDQDPDMVLKQIMELINRHAQDSGARDVAMRRATAMKAAQAAQGAQ